LRRYITFSILVKIPRNTGLQSQNVEAGHFARSRSSK